MENRIEIENDTDALAIVNILASNNYKVIAEKDCGGVWIIEYEYLNG